MVLAGIWENRSRRRHIAQGREEGREQGIAQGREEGIAQGREQANIVWRDWLRRKEAAAAAGQPFNEPMPGTIGSIASGGNAPPSLQP